MPAHLWVGSEDRDVNDASLPPVAPGHRPVVGHTLAFLRDPLGSLSTWANTDDAVQRLAVGGRRICLVSDAAVADAVLRGDAASYRKAEVVRERLGTLQGGSLVLLEGEEWADRRRVLRSGFASERVAAAGDVTVRYASEMVDDWPADGPVPLATEARDLSLRVLARALFGLELDDGGTPIHAAADDVLARLDMRSPSTYLPEWVPTPTNRRFRRAVDALHGELDAVVAEREATAAGLEADESPDLLSTMLAAGLPAETVRDELIAFLFAGFDSTATALACTLGLLAANPDVQGELQAELDGELDGDPPTAGALDALPYLDAVVREAVRLHPPQYVLFREPTADVTLAGRRVPAGTTVVVAPWTLHRDPRYWTRPEAFEPARWLGDDAAASETVDGDATAGDGRPAGAYLPYGAGPRHCMGMALARQTLRLVVATVCRRRTLRRDEAPTVAAGPTLSLESDVAVEATPRE